MAAKKKKTCNRCHEEKTLDEFYRSTASDDGYKPYCKDCSRAYHVNRKDPKANMGPMYRWCTGCKTWKQKGRSFTVCRYEANGDKPVYYRRCDVCLAADGYFDAPPEAGDADFDEGAYSGDLGGRPADDTKRPPKKKKRTVSTPKPKQLNLFDIRPLEAQLTRRTMREIFRECARIGTAKVLTDIKFMIEKRIGEMYPKEAQRREGDEEA